MVNYFRLRYLGWAQNEDGRKPPTNLSATANPPDRSWEGILVDIARMAAYEVRQSHLESGTESHAMKHGLEGSGDPPRCLLAEGRW